MLTPLQVVTLAVFAERPQHAYDVLRTVTERRGDRVVKLRTGTLYHAISRLADEGLLRVAGIDRAGGRPERTSYAITDAGRAALRASIAELIGTPRYEYPSFPAAIGEAHLLGREEVVALLRSRAAAIASESEALDAAFASLAARRVLETFVLDLRWQRDAARHEADWCTRLADEIERGDVPWPGEPGYDEAKADMLGHPPEAARFASTPMHPSPPIPTPHDAGREPDDAVEPDPATATTTVTRTPEETS